jgi:hypothetical protein
MKRFEKKIFWCITAFGLALPWIIGTGVKLYLEIQSKPTWPWAFFFQPHIFIMSLICTVWFATPYIGLALLAWFILSRRSFFRTGYLERLIIILGGFLCGSVAAVKIFLSVFWEFDPIIFLAVSLPASYATYMLIGLLGGSVVATVMVLLRKPPSPPKFNSIKNLNEQEVGAFVRKEADYYLKKWQPILEGRSQWAGFNWAAFFLTGLWLAYRKMFKGAFIFYGIILIVSFLKWFYTFAFLFKPEPPVALNILEGLVVLVAGIICGTFGNIWYLSRTRKEINEIRTQGLQEEAYFQSLSKSGGTSLGKSLGFIILLFLCQIGVFLLATFAAGLMHFW